MTDLHPITRWQAWQMAARPSTLPAAVAPVIVGAALATRDGTFRPLITLAALTGALLLQIGVNLANDYFDFRAGIDAGERKGPIRVTQSGLIPPAHVRLAMIGVLVLAALIGVYLVLAGGWPILLIGLASLAAVLIYSSGPFPLASHGLGDLAVFLFFGPAAVWGTYLAQARYLPWPIALAALPPGFLITAILVVNNLRDIDSDQVAGKRTLAVRIGRRGSLIEYTLLIAAAYAVPVIGWLVGGYSVAATLPLVTTPLALPLIATLRDRPDDGPAMNHALAGTARLALLACLAFGVGLLVPAG